MTRLLASAAALALAAAAFGGPAQAQESACAQQVDIAAPAIGPHGETAAPAEQITLSEEEMAQLREGGHSAALLWHGTSDWINATSTGAKDRLAELGIEVAAEAEAQYDPAKQANDVETALALEPDAILTLVLDPVQGAAAYRAAVDRGVKLALLSNPIEGFAAGQDYVGIVTDNMIGMGVAAAELMGDAVGGDGRIGYIYHAANYFITNARDNAFCAAIEQRFPGLEIATAQGFTAEPQTFDIATAMIQQNPDIEGIYVAWEAAAQGVVEALRAAGRADVKVVTHDLGASSVLDMAQGGNVYGIVADLPYDIGQGLANLAAYGILGKQAPAFSTVGFLKVTRDNIADAWSQSFRRDLPEVVFEALQ
jgi:ribose transport system substrate-binding protein